MSHGNLLTKAQIIQKCMIHLCFPYTFTLLKEKVVLIYTSPSRSIRVHVLNMKFILKIEDDV